MERWVIAIWVATSVSLTFANLLLFFINMRLLRKVSIPLKQLASRSTVSVLKGLLNSSPSQNGLDQLTIQELSQLMRLFNNAAFRVAAKEHNSQQQV